MTEILDLILIILLLSFAYAGLSAAPWVPSAAKRLGSSGVLNYIKPGSVIYELGSGDGRILKYLASQTQASKIVGYEISLMMFLYSWFNVKLSPSRHKIKIRYKNLFKVDFSQADVVYCFLTPRTMKKLKPALLHQMKKDSLLISYAFKLPELEPMEKFKEKASYLPVYLYKF